MGRTNKINLLFTFFTWRRTVEAKATAMGHSLGTFWTLAHDRLRWREFVAALVVYDKKGSK